jgi:hypothetical protein
MSALDWILLAVLLALTSPVWMYLLYIPAVQYKRGGWWSLMYPVTMVTAALDVVFNYTVWAAYTNDMPKGVHEVTFSKRLDRLILREDWLGSAGRVIAAMLDFWDPTGKHV